MVVISITRNPKANATSILLLGASEKAHVFLDTLLDNIQHTLDRVINYLLQIYLIKNMFCHKSPRFSLLLRYSNLLDIFRKRKFLFSDVLLHFTMTRYGCVIASDCIIGPNEAIR